MKTVLIFTALIALTSTCVQAQSARKTSATPVRPAEPTAGQVAARENAVSEHTTAANAPQPNETTHRLPAAAPKGIIAIGPSTQFNGELETTLIGGSVGLGYAVGRKFGVLLAADYQAGNHTAVASRYPADLIESYSTSSTTLRPEFRFYPKRSFEGFFIGLNGTFMSYKVGGFRDSKLVINDETAGGAGLVLGVNISTSSRLNFEFGLSGAVISGADYEAIVGSGALRIGYAF